MKDLGFPLSKRCRTITEKFINDPLAMLFLAHYEPPEDIAEAYHAKVSTPMDLATVKMKLQNEGYTNHEEWVRDMNLIFDNAINFNGDTSVIGGVALYFKRKLDRYVQRFELSNTRNFEAKLIEAYRNLQNTIQAIPAEMGIAVEPEEPCPALDDFTVARFESLKQKLGEVVAAGKMEDVLAILRLYDPDVLNGLHPKIDVARLSRHSLILLEELVNRA